MDKLFPYLSGRTTPTAAPTAASRDVSQEEAPPHHGEAAPDAEQFDDDRDTHDFVFPNLEQDLAPETRATLARTRGEQRRLDEIFQGGAATAREQNPAPPTPAPATPGGNTLLSPVTPRAQASDEGPSTGSARGQSVITCPMDSALAQACQQMHVSTPSHLYEFLEWQALRKASPVEQGNLRKMP